MGIQVIVTESGEELVVLTRRDYDAMLVGLGDEEAEDRADARIAADIQARIASGEEPPPMPAEVVFPMIDGTSPLRAIREHAGLTLADVASTSGLSEADLRPIDDGERAAIGAERDLIASALGVDPRWLDPLSD